MADSSTSLAVTSENLDRMALALYNTEAAVYDVNRAAQAAFDAARVQILVQQMNVYGYQLEQTNIQLGEMEDKTAKATKQANILQNAYKGVKDIISKCHVQEILETSDKLALATSQLDLMNQKFNEVNGSAYETSELVQMVYASAQDARGSFSGMLGVVTEFGNNAGEAFSSHQEMVTFANLMQKEMAIAGTSATDAEKAMISLSQAFSSGDLSNSELDSVLEQAPGLIQNIADYLNVPTDAIREMASEGQLTTDIVKNAVFDAAGDIDGRFQAMPMTWDQIWQSMKNSALMIFQPILQRINAVANSEGFQQLINGVSTGMAVVANIVLNIFELVGAVGAFVADNWSVISPIIYGAAAALGLYTLALGIYSAAQLISNIQEGIATVQKYVHAKAILANSAAYSAETVATASATVAQASFNTILAACPLTWIIILIIGLVAAIIALCSWIAKNTDVANSWFGVLTGGVNVVIQFFKNLGLSIANIALGIWNALGACAENIGIAFRNSIKNIQALFYGLLSVALLVVAGICEALNKLPFVEFDYSGITAKADEYAAKSMEAIESKEDYVSIGDAFNEGMSTFDTFQDGWVSNAFSEGAAWGDGVSDKLSSKLDELTSTFDTSSFNPNGIDSNAIDNAYTTTDSGSVADNLSNIANDTSNISDSVDISNENLKYLRDIAERDTINRFTTAEIKVDMQNYNTISNNMDLDGVVNTICEGINGASELGAEGVHE